MSDSAPSPPPSLEFLPDSVRERLLTDVRAKKDLSFLSTDFITYHANEQLRLNKKLREIFTSTTAEKLVKSREYESLIKFIRAKARTSYAVFQIPSLVGRRKELLEKGTLSDREAMDELLQTHLSTKERIEVYPQLLSLVASFAGNADGKIDRIHDLACGLNPIAYYHFTGNKKTAYICNEVSDLDCAQLNAFFKHNKLPAIAQSFDLVREVDKLRLPPFSPVGERFDVCFLLKTLDTLESQRLYITYDILKSIQARCIVASFPIQSIKGKRMERSDQIFWFEKMLGRLAFSFTRQVLGNEVFYFCKK